MDGGPDQRPARLARALDARGGDAVGGPGAYLVRHGVGSAALRSQPPGFHQSADPRALQRTRAAPRQLLNMDTTLMTTHMKRCAHLAVVLRCSFGAAACDSLLEVELPAQLGDDALDDPAGAESMVITMIEHF